MGHQYQTPKEKKMSVSNRTDLRHSNFEYLANFRLSKKCRRSPKNTLDKFCNNYNKFETFFQQNFCAIK